MKKFANIIFLRILLIALLISPIFFLIFRKQWLLAFLFFSLTVWAVVDFYNYIISINKKLTLFFESIQYSDFAVKFSSDNSKGQSFKDLNLQLNKVIDAFKKTRAEKEITIQFLNSMVQNIDVGIICVNKGGEIEVINNAAMRLLNSYRLNELKDLLRNENDEIYYALSSIIPGSRMLFQTKEGNQLAINSSRVNLRGREIKIISLQNIRSELQEKELKAWQNLTKVLRHEIMNSIAPIVSLVGTMKSIINEDLKDIEKNENSIEDLKEAIGTIETRGKGIMNFVNAYRDYTTLPKPSFNMVNSSELIQQVESLTIADANKKGIEIIADLQEDFELNCDKTQIEMVLINLVKNAFEAFEEGNKGEIKIISFKKNGRRYIKVQDNGRGIVNEALDKIFIPFFSTKKTGQGIGLSLSKQIMQMHGGELSVSSEPDKGTSFLMEF